MWPTGLLTIYVQKCTFVISTENIALNKMAHQQFPYIQGDAMFEASNAVDGHKSNLSVWGGQCTRSRSQRTATWWVNLGSIFSIHHITFYFMTNNTPAGNIISCILLPIVLIFTMFLFFYFF